MYGFLILYGNIILTIYNLTTKEKWFRTNKTLIVQKVKHIRYTIPSYPNNTILTMLWLMRHTPTETLLFLNPSRNWVSIPLKTSFESIHRTTFYNYLFSMIDHTILYVINFKIRFCSESFCCLFHCFSYYFLFCFFMLLFFYSWIFVHLRPPTNMCYLGSTWCWPPALFKIESKLYKLKIKHDTHKLNKPWVLVILHTLQKAANYETRNSQFNYGLTNFSLWKKKI